jgi:hypothetical protein
MGRGHKLSLENVSEATVWNSIEDETYLLYEPRWIEAMLGDIGWSDVYVEISVIIDCLLVITSNPELGKF